MGFSKETAGHGESLDDRIDHLWERAVGIAKKLDKTDEEREEQLAIYTEILGLIDVDSTSLNVSAIYRNRAITYRALNRYDEALNDLTNALNAAKRQGNSTAVADCARILRETREEKLKHQGDADEPWTRFKQYVSMAEDGPDSAVIANMRFQFMFPDEAAAKVNLAQLPWHLNQALQNGNLWYRGPAAATEREGTGWIQLGWDRVRLSIGEGKELMNHVVNNGGEIYEAFLT